MQTITGVSVEEYFEMLLKSDVKLEYHGGEIVAMAGAQPSHNLICSNLNMEIGLCLKKNNCLILTSDQLLKLEVCEKFVYPDLVIVCEKPIFEKHTNGLDALQNPTIIIEVLSDSTELYDRTEKWECYKTLESLKEYVLVASKKKKVEVFRRFEGDDWLQHTYFEKDGKVKIGDCELLFEDIYNKFEMIPL